MYNSGNSVPRIDYTGNTGHRNRVCKSSPGFWRPNLNLDLGGTLKGLRDPGSYVLHSRHHGLLLDSLLVDFSRPHPSPSELLLEVGVHLR